MSDECLKCKNHYTQGGSCNLSKNNCLMFDEEQRGKIIRTNLTFDIDVVASTPIIKHNSKVKFDDKNGTVIEMTIIKINVLNLTKRLCNVTVEYYENEMPFIEKKRKFKIIN